MEKLRLMDDFHMKEKEDNALQELADKKDSKKFELLDELVKKEKKEKRNA